MRRGFPLALLALARGAAGAAPLPCAYAFPDAFVDYDLSGAAAAPLVWTAPNGALFHSLAICALLPAPRCAGGRASSSVYGDVGTAACLQNFGSAAGAGATLLSADAAGGLRLVYDGGDACGAVPFANNTAVVLASCGGGAPVITDYKGAGGGCVATFSVSGAAFCGRLRTRVLPRALPVGAVVTLALVGAGALYCAGGAAYKRRVLGARGLEALPNIAFWRAAAAAVTCGRCGPRAGGDEYNDLKASEELGGLA